MKILLKSFFYLLFATPIFGLCQTIKTDSIPKISSYIKKDSREFKGMFNVYLQNEKYLIEIPDKIIGRDILTNIGIIAGSAQRKRDPELRFGFAGDAVNDQVIRLAKNNGKIEIFPYDFIKATDTINMYISSLKARLPASLYALEILARSDTSSLVDMTKLFSEDNELFSLKKVSDELKLGAFDPNKSSILGVSTFSDNIVFRSVKSYFPGQPATVGNSSTGPAKKAPTDPTIWQVGASWYLLPEKPMQPRYADKRVGYFTSNLENYDLDSSSVEKWAMANRWRVEPRAQDVKRYLNGELVEPQKPIVFYVDRNTPPYLIPYIISGVNYWQSAFEKIGFKNAIIGKLAPTPQEDPNFSIDDVRYSYISYKPSEMANAYGPQVVDPRSGEILSSHVGVFHNILGLLQRWYFSMCANTDPAARNANVDKDLMGNMLKNVITHEVGHAIGLRHNFAGSSSFDIDSIRHPEYVRKNSFGASVMDYMRFNYVAQPGDKMKPADLRPKIGAYDDFVIDWGYRYRPEFIDPFKEKQFLMSWVSEKRKDPRFFYLEEGDFYDPRVQTEDVGNNSMKANRLGVANLKATMANLEKWTSGDDDSYTALRSNYRAIQGRYYTYLGHVLKNIGGVYIDYPLRSENKQAYRPVSVATQKEAVKYLIEFMLTEPEWLYPRDIRNKTRFNFSTDVELSYGDFLGRIITRDYFMSKIEERLGDKAYSYHEFINTIYAAIFKNLQSNEPITEYQRMLQRVFVNKILANVGSKNNLVNNVGVTLAEILDRIVSDTKTAASLKTDLISKSHLIAMNHIVLVWRNGTKSILLDNLTSSTIKP